MAALQFFFGLTRIFKEIDEITLSITAKYYLEKSKSRIEESNLQSINVVAPFESVDETLVCDHSNQSYWAALSSDAVCF